ncbi:hypothetical protein [Ruminococcus flavefaciens]|uniref:SipW-cognate class signal peptide n=1 Tax=Ruminococcus flavefaciens TaxID=1265 RepID=A0A1K1NBN6_RUMFL|nr:hypothetical protein [Ruminococcus flavefaciens]SFW32767.1 hypothetical protein SAMN02910280_1803 [Ruminococcus flavefaciens]
MMKTNAKRKNSAVKKLIPAAGMLALSASMLATSTYAWFTMNTTVTVTGMSLKTTVESNLLIADDTIASTAKKADSNFSTATLSQSVAKILEPVSTANGKNFFYTVDALANGDARTDAYTAYNASAVATGGNASDYMDKFSQDYGLTKNKAKSLISGEQGAYAYADYVFQLKADNTSTNPEVIDLTQLDLTYTKANSEVDTNKAYRAAIFVEDITAGTATADAGELVGIWAPTGADNFTDGKAVNSASTVEGDVTYVSAATGLATVPANSTKYYKVVVRMYIEGEDETCYTAKFNTLVGKWTLDMKLKLQSDNTPAGVKSITMLPISGE